MVVLLEFLKMCNVIGTISGDFKLCDTKAGVIINSKYFVTLLSKKGCIRNSSERIAVLVSNTVSCRLSSLLSPCLVKKI